ncbi:MAG: DUF6036 family nucleotidyltransferase [Galactobacter sp.]
MTDGSSKRRSAPRLQALFQDLSDRLAFEGQNAHLFIVGGAAMALEYDQQRTTRDIDAIFVPTDVMRRLATDVAVARGLEPDWINDTAKGSSPAAILNLELSSNRHPRSWMSPLRSAS